MIRKLNHTIPDIAARINELQKESYRVEAGLIHYPNHPNLNQAINDIQMSVENFIGYEDEKVLAGVISYELEDQKKLTICRLVIKPSYFGRGIARKLIRAVQDMEPDVTQLVVGTAKKNHPAVNLYIKEGFRLFHEFKTDDGLELVRFRKIIKSN